MQGTRMQGFTESKRHRENNKTTEFKETKDDN